MDKVDLFIEQQYGSGEIIDKILDGLSFAGKNIQSLTVGDLAPIDAFHTRGRESTLELAELANIKASDLVLDVGCGLGGTARHLADQYKCRVMGIDLTEEYIAIGKKLTELVGLAGQVELHRGNALEIPYEDGEFDLVWTEHVQMNVTDKNRFYSELARVLKPHGHLLFHDIFRGTGEEPYYPVPWAEEESRSALVTEAEARTTLEQAGMVIDEWIGKVEQSINFFTRVLAKTEADGPPPIGIHILMGNNAQDKLQNYLRGLRERRVTVALGMAHKG